MPDNYDNGFLTKIDVRRIPNYLILAHNKKFRREYPLIFHILYALAAALCIYLAVDGACLGFSVLNLAGLCIGPAMLVYTFMYSPVWIKSASVALPALAYVVRHLFFVGSLSLLHETNHCLIYILCILVSAFLTLTALCGYSKSKCFLLVSAAYVAVILGGLAVLVVYYKGSLTLMAIKEALDGFFSAVVSSSVKNFSTPEMMEYVRAALPAAKDLSDGDILFTVKEAFVLSTTYVKTLLPSIITSIGMFFAFITVEIFSYAARRRKIDLFVCIMDDVWSYRPGTVTYAFFDILFFVYIIGSLTDLPSNIAITVENLMNIMMPVMFVVGIKAIYNYFFKKNNSKGKSVAICAGITVLVLGFLGTVGLLIIGSVGVTLMSLRDREEEELLPAKMLEQKEECELFYPDLKKDDTNKSDDDK